MLAYRIKSKLTDLYSDGNGSGEWWQSKNTADWAWWGKHGTWSAKGKIFFGRHRIKAYLNQFTNQGGNLNFDLLADLEIIEIGNNGTTVISVASFYHTWELLTNKIWEAEKVDG
jgi:hypothetical protein